MRRILIPILMIISLSRLGFADERSGSYVEVTVEYSSMFPGYVQIKDQECTLSAYLECEKARIRLQREDCGKHKRSPECREAEELLTTSFCIPGLIHEGMASAGDKVTVSVCKSSGGFGNIAIRNLWNGEVWTNYFLITDGKTLKYP